MSVPSPASRQVALLIVITGLFAVVWSTDSGHRDEPMTQSPSAIAILMQTTAADSLSDDDFIGWSPESHWETQCNLAQYVSTSWPVVSHCAISDVSPAVEPESVGEDVVVAPIPEIVDSPVIAPVPDAAPVLAPLPPQRFVPLAEWSRSIPLIQVATQRVTMDYRMTCHCCREYCGTSARRVAVLKRQAREMLKSLTETVARSANNIDWKTRLSTAPGGEDSPRRH